VLSFDEFLAIPGCAEVDGHSSEAPKVPEPKPSSTTTFTVAESSTEGKETYSTTSAAASGVSSQVNPEPLQPSPPTEEEDDPTEPVTPGTPCRRRGCGVPFVSDQENRQGDGPGTVCVYHPAPVSGIEYHHINVISSFPSTQPIFREGSKGYLCCKRRVLEFDEFLKIQGCKTGRHVFAPRGAAAPAKEEVVDCRIDHYQTVDKVYVSVFAKQVDKERTVIKYDSPEQVTLDVYLPGSKRFSRVLNLFGPIIPDQSTYRFSNAKIELQLQKSDNRGWVVLEKTNRSLGGINYTFGVGGRTGTVGGKELHLDAVNKTRST